MNVNIVKLHPGAMLPTYAHGVNEDAGMDLYAVTDVYLKKNIPTLVKTGISIELPVGFEGQIRSRSGLALKQGVVVFNSPGTIDPSYRGEIGVILLWNGYKPTHHNTSAGLGPIDETRLRGYTLYEHLYKVSVGDRIAQLVVARYEAVRWVGVDSLTDTARGAGGFGSTESNSSFEPVNWKPLDLEEYKEAVQQHLQNSTPK